MRGQNDQSRVTKVPPFTLGRVSAMSQFRVREHAVGRLNGDPRKCRSKTLAIASTRAKEAPPRPHIPTARRSSSQPS
jgi:hypothetical protein